MLIITLVSPHYKIDRCSRSPIQYTDCLLCRVPNGVYVTSNNSAWSVPKEISWRQLFARTSNYLQQTNSLCSYLWSVRSICHLPVVLWSHQATYTFLFWLAYAKRLYSHNLHSFIYEKFLLVNRFFMESIHYSHCCLPSDHYHRYHTVVCGDEWVLFNAAQVSWAGQFHIPPCLPTPVGAVITYSLATPFRCRPGVHVWHRPWSGKLWRNKLFCLP